MSVHCRAAKRLGQGPLRLALLPARGGAKVQSHDIGHDRLQADQGCPQWPVAIVAGLDGGVMQGGALSTLESRWVGFEAMSKPLRAQTYFAEPPSRLDGRHVRPANDMFGAMNGGPSSGRRPACCGQWSPRLAVRLPRPRDRAVGCADDRTDRPLDRRGRPRRPVRRRARPVPHRAGGAPPRGRGRARARRRNSLDA